MLSRVAENLYWMSRYLERAENTARLVSVGTNLLLDLPTGMRQGWEPLIAISGCDEIYPKSHGDYGERAVLRFLIGAKDNPGSISASLQSARENCRTIRDIVPREVWEQINALHLYAREHMQEGLTKRGRHPFPAADRAALPDHRRQGLRHHEPRPGLPVPAPGPQPGAGRHDHAHPRRQLRQPVA